MKQVFLFLTAVLCLCTAGRTFAQTVASGTTGGCMWTLSGEAGDYTLTISGFGMMANYNDPENINWAPWYDYHTEIKTLVIEYGVMSIGHYAFLGCQLSGTLTIPNTVKSIGTSAFSGCRDLTGPLIIPNSVETIHGQAFHGCRGFTGPLELPGSLKMIDGGAFQGCTGFTGDLIIPGSLKTISSAFSGCSGFTSLTLPPGAEIIEMSAFSGCSGLTGKLELPATIREIKATAFAGCSGLTGHLELPPAIAGIGDGAFSGCSFTSISVPASATSISYSAFSGRTLTGISVSEDNPGYCSIDGVLFNKDQSILIRYPASKAGGYVIPNTVKTLGREAFYVSDGLTSVVFGDSVKIMELYVFKGCANLNSVKLNSTLKSIGSGAFDRCISLKTIDIPSSVTSISDAFGYSGLTAVNIPNSVQMIGQQCFRNCEDLRSVTIGDSVKQIGTLTFYYCRKLASLTLGSSIDSIGEGAFRGCSALEEIHIRAVNPPGTKEECFGEGAHNAVPTGIPVYVPCGSVEAYQNAETWSNFTNYAETPPVLVSLSTNNDRLGTASITKAGSCSDNTAVIEAVSAGENTRFMHWNDGNTDNPRTLALTQDTALTAIFEVMVASGTVGTWQWSVAGQPNDYTLTISGAGNMNSYAGGASLPWWNYRLGITSLVVEEGIQNVGSNALNSFAYLTSVSLANTVTAIGSKAFSECTALPSIDIPASVTGIAADAFDFAADCDLAGPWAWSCSHDCVFSAINVDSGNETYASHDGVLLNKDRSEVILCPKGKAGSYAIPATVTAIRDNAFAACNRLTEVSLPHSAVTIGNYAFYRCTGLRSLNISASTVAIGDYAFESCRQWTEAVEIPNSTKTIGKWAFRGCSNITSLSLGDSIVDIGEYAFQSCISLSGSVTIPNTLKVISDHIFYNCLKVSAVTLGDSVTSIGDNAFGLTAIESIVIPNSVTYIGVNAFAGCTSLRSAVLPESLTSIINQPFYNCNNLASITIPASVTSIGNYAFAYNSGLTEIIMKAVNPPALGERAFFNVSTIIPVTVPCGSTEAYQNADGWSDFSNYAEQAFARITVHSDDESMGAAVVTQDNTCENGNTAVIEAIPAPGFKFARWNDRDAQYKKNPRTIAVTADMELTARFEVDETYTVGGTTATSGTELPSFTVYPNPFTDYIIIDAAVNEEAVIYDLSGKAVLTASVKPGSNRIDTPALPKGVYLLKQGAKTMKIVK